MEYEICKRCNMVVKPPYYCLCFWSRCLINTPPGLCECNEYAGVWVHPDENESNYDNKGVKYGSKIH